MYIASVYVIIGDLEMANETWEQFKAYHLAHGDEYNPKELDACFQQVEEELAEIRSYMNAET